MTDRTFRVSLIAGAVVLYAGLLSYGLLGFGSGPSDDSGTSSVQQRPPRVMYYGSNVTPYQRRNVRSGTQRGGGIRGGK